MKRHNKFRVKQVFTGTNKYEITFAPLGSLQNILAANNALTKPITLDEAILEELLNATYDEAYEKGREAVAKALREAMGFDGE